MNKDIKATWLKALRSGGYSQGTDALKRIKYSGRPQYCCLGVLCQLYIKEHKEARFGGQTFSDGELESKEMLTSKVARWAGLSNTDPCSNERGRNILGGTRRLPLSHLNDNGKSFKEIADIIERDF